jgi:hypothetical protein
MTLTNPICHTLRLGRGVRSEDVASNRLSQMKSKLAIIAVIKHVVMGHALILPNL